MIRSLAGGTGSGLGAIMNSKTREEYPSLTFASNIVLPSEETDDNILSPYNTVLGIHSIVENTDIAFTYENKTMEDLCRNKLGV